MEAFSKALEMYPLFRVGITLQEDQEYFKTLKNLCLIKENTTPFEFLHELIETEKIDPVKKNYKYLVNIVKTFSFEPKGKKSSFEPPQDQISSQLNEKTDFKVTGVAILEMLDLN